MKKWLVITPIIVIVLLGLFFLTSNITGKVSLDFDSSLKIGDQVSGNLVIQLEEGDSVEKDTPIIVSLSKKSFGSESVIEAQTLTFEEFIALSNNPISPIQKDGKYYYESPGIYEVKTSSIIKSVVQEPGEYELYFKIFNPDITIKKTFLVE